MERMEVTFSFMKKEYEIKDNDEHISRYERICAEKEDGIKEIEERRRKALEWAYRTHVGGEKQAASRAWTGVRS